MPASSTTRINPTDLIEGLGKGLSVIESFDEDPVRWIGEHDFVGLTAYTVTDPNRLRDQVREARALDGWTTEQQLDLDLCGLSLEMK